MGSRRVFAALPLGPQDVREKSLWYTRRARYALWAYLSEEPAALLGLEKSWGDSRAHRMFPQPPLVARNGRLLVAFGTWAQH